jgi:DNA-binding CsgD family transcriptional regulator
MPGRKSKFWCDRAFGFADHFLKTVRGTVNSAKLGTLMRDISDDMGFRYFALVTHEYLRVPHEGQVNLRDYPEGASARIIGDGQYHRDPVMRAAIFADSAFLWSDLGNIIRTDNRDRVAFELGSREGLNEGITVPCTKHGHRLGSCTFAGLKAAGRAELLLGPVQLIGVFAFQRARSLAGAPAAPAPLPRLEPRLRDCIILAGQGIPDKLIAHRLGLTPRTVESYLRDARRLFEARDRTELAAAAVLAGEIGLDELRSRQEP